MGFNFGLQINSNDWLTLKAREAYKTEIAILIDISSERPLDWATHQCEENVTTTIYKKIK